MWIILAILLIINVYRSAVWIQLVICRKTNDFWHVIAPPGTGKTTLAAHLLRQAKAEKKKVYSNKPLRGAIQLDVKGDLGIFDIRDAICLIDEGGSELGNRDWQNNLTKASITFIKLHRHYNIDIYVFSQSPNDIDVKFRDLVTRKYLLYKSKIPFYIYAQSLKKVMTLENGQIIDYLEPVKEECFRVFMPPTWAYFNSWDKTMVLRHKDEKIYTLLDT